MQCFVIIILKHNCKRNKNVCYINTSQNIHHFTNHAQLTLVWSIPSEFPTHPFKSPPFFTYSLSATSTGVGGLFLHLRDLFLVESVLYSENSLSVGSSLILTATSMFTFIYLFIFFYTFCFFFLIYFIFIKCFFFQIITITYFNEFI